MARNNEKRKDELNQIVAYSERVESLGELANVLGLTKGQIQYRLKNGYEGVREEVKEKIKNVAEATRNNGIKTIRIRKFPSWNTYIIDSPTTQIIIDSGKYFPKQYDIVYMLHDGVGITKLLVKEVKLKTNKFGVFLNCVVLGKFDCTYLKNCMEHNLTGVDVMALTNV